MKKILLIIPAFLLIISCNQRQNTPDQEELLIMHKLVERTRPDSVGKYMNYYYQKYDLPYTFSELPDGKYHGESPYDDFDYKHIISLKVEDGKVTKVEYDEIHRDGHSKTSDSSYNAEMNANAYGSAPRVTYNKYEQQLIDKQDFSKLDAISGATYSRYRLQYAALKAILNGPVDGE